MWLLRRGQKAMLQKLTSGKGYIIDVLRFHAAVRQSLEDYYQEIVDPSQSDRRGNLWKKMGNISGVRTARGLLVEAE